ncbi:AMP-binding protein [Cupriavidus necator]|uniref:AMP-binding protein n=1 Tax=Cupriavidus necator TaxID=106590 RepID=UPI002351CF72|nr:AMP-binding protein [Cupriavidus necator]
MDNPRSDGVDFDAAIDKESTAFSNVPRSPHDLTLMLFTSGTAGKPKAVVVPLRAVEAFRAYMKYAIDLRDDDVFGNIADPGWAYGLYYGVIGPLSLGQAVTFYNGPFTAESTYEVIKRFGVTNLTGAPTAYRLLIAAGQKLAAETVGKLRVVSSAGEALNPEVIRWFHENLNCQIHDHYGQTEGGMILANHHGLQHPIVMGTVGLAIPGLKAVILDDNSVELECGQVGELAVDRARSPLFWFEGYGLLVHSRVDTPRYHRTGDLAKMDESGAVTFVGRADDVITTSGYRVGPFDVESTLMEHPAVAETAVIGKADPERTELIKALVVLKAGYLPNNDLAEELKIFVKKRLAAHAYPRELEFLAELPKTPSGKIQRFVLREREANRAAAVND